MAKKSQGSRRSWAEYLEFLSDIGVESIPRAPAGAADPEERAALPATSVPPPASVPSVRAPSRAANLSLFPASPGGEKKKDPNLEAVLADIGDCRRCKLWEHRSRIVFGSGNPQARVMFVGEGPGADEDEQGVPFVGKAGQLLTKIIEAIRFTREEVYIANVVKCRPPGNRTPEDDEILACQGFLFRQVELVRPWILCALGAPATKTLLGVKTPIGHMRGRWFQCRGAELIPTYHPSYLLRNPTAKKDVWADVQSLRARYDQMCLERNSGEKET